MMTETNGPPSASADEIAIGLDLGGREAKGVAMRLKDGHCLGRETVPTRDGEMENGHPAFVNAVRTVMERLAIHCDRAISRVGLAAPGLADRAGSSIAHMPGRLKGLEGLDWAEALGCKAVAVLNDAHAALMGEIWLGAARGMRDVVMLTLGTGVGGAIVSGGQLLTGHAGRAGHLGHMTVDYRGERDICGMPGSIEDAIGTATLKARSGGRFDSTQALVEAYEREDPQAREVWLESLKALAATIASIGNALDPEAVVLGGGIVSAGKTLFIPLTKYLDQWEWRPGGRRIKLCAAQLGTWAGAYGAAYRALQVQG